MSKQDHKQFSAFYGFVFISEIILNHHCNTALSVKAISTAATNIALSFIIQFEFSLCFEYREKWDDKIIGNYCYVPESN